MDRRNFMLSTAALAGTGLFGAAGSARAEGYPTRPVTIIVPFAAGGAGDLSARVVADYASNRRGHATAVDFRPGAGATLGTTQIAEAKPDGTTIGLYSVSPFGTTPHLQKVAYDPLKDFTYISAYVFVPIAFYVKADSQFRRWEEVVRYAVDNPGKLRWGTAAVRGAAHVATEAAFRKAGAKTTFVPFKGGAEAMTALLGGHIEASVSSDFGPQLAAGQVRLLASTGSEKVPGQPDVPTFAELGQPLAIEATYGLVGPAGLPPEAVAYWNAVIRDLQATPDFKAYLDVVKGGRMYWDSAEFTEKAKEAYVRLGRTIKELGL
ncbi:Bug family tripartite tricarboxylate transporter substrate binding protein [Chelatococcus asaccharovorans]|uniref:Bug family tripartite tricarboxylate transporter substrate binding protein n=1 Tax=Chelatococcus asaccharovorans TaxID=28210 RepID=UPI00224C63A4|nr:tripartite tricarboxylate transporter substrate binding protein [Chelatococcus asaccharovorans]CAH1673319.1 Tripartite-type tricarboxylate transporter receptor subunit TctC [Chelatococcus asaccharovorans]CAH1675264.1 Tripartite-type tricarboxylate transporter receptor subunit TctC [Chelatococcus asaccharovorans]